MRRIAVFTFLLPIFFSSCVSAESLQTTVPIIEDESALSKIKSLHSIENTSSIPALRLTFAGDLMAHTVNFNMSTYDLIYTDVEKILHNDDLSFVNIETPICDALPLSTYPCFNVHTPYLRAAIGAGFDVLSLAITQMIMVKPVSMGRSQRFGQYKKNDMLPKYLLVCSFFRD